MPRALRRINGREQVTRCSYRVTQGSEIAGQFDNLPAIARFNPDGSLDTRFGTRGMAVTGIEQRARVEDGG